MKCKNCGEEIATSNRWVFCSEECSVIYQHMKRKNLYCEICGKPLTGRQMKHCSYECRKKANVIRVKNDKEKYKKPKAEETPKKVQNKKDFLSIEEAARLAKAEGLSWGEYYVKHKLYEK